MAINKVVYGNSTLIDLTEDTVSANNLLAGETAHDRSGASIEGALVTTEIWTGTQAEYEAQASQIADGTVVQITDDEKAITLIESEEIYSTEERMVGVWIDGKPLYKKSFILSTSLTVSHETFTDTGISIPNVDAIRNGVVYRIGNLGLIACDFNVKPNNTIGLRNSTSYDISFSDGSVITILYTKTNDVAGSGDVVPSGAPAVHYSTDEQVVGTFLNKPLYRKSFVFTNIVTCSSQNWTRFPEAPASNISDIVSAFFEDANGTLFIPTGTNVDSGTFGVLQTRNANVNAKKFTVEYTKTTD